MYERVIKSSGVWFRGSYVRSSTLNHLPCRSSKVWKNGCKANRRQSSLCSTYRKQFQQEYVNKGSSPVVRKQVVKIFIRNCGLRDKSTTAKLRTLADQL